MKKRKRNCPKAPCLKTLIKFYLDNLDLRRALDALKDCNSCQISSLDECDPFLEEIGSDQRSIDTALIELINTIEPHLAERMSIRPE